MIDQFFKVLDTLNKYNVEYILIGGFALNLYGLQRGTQDIDLFVNPTSENNKRIKEALFSIFMDDSINEITLNDLKEYAVIRYGTENNFYIDIISQIGELFFYKDLSYKILDIDNHKIRLATEETLLKLKSNSYREIDASDVKFLKYIIEKKKNGNS